MAETTPAEAAQPDEPRRRVAEVARREAAPAGRRAPRVRDETVFVWPSLLVIESGPACWSSSSWPRC
jgi:hypothetical protein